MKTRLSSSSPTSLRGLLTDAPLAALPMRVLSVRERIYFPDGRTGVLLHLGNYCQEAWVAGYEPRFWEGYPMPHPHEGQCLRVTLGPYTQVNGCRALLGWQAVPADTAGVAWLPRSWAVCPGDLIRLHHQVAAVQTPALRELLQRVLSEPDFARKFLRVPASRDHHHREPGGLLRHSLETVDLLMGQWQAAATLERDLLITAGLVHDIGKVRVYRADGAYTQTGLIVHHDDLTLETLASELARLPARLADGLRHLLCRSDKARHYPRSALRSALRQADALSAERYHQAKAFEHLPDYRFRDRDDQGQSRYRLPPRAGG